MKGIGGLRKLRHRGGPLVEWIFIREFIAAHHAKAEPGCRVVRASIALRRPVVC